MKSFCKSIFCALSLVTAYSSCCVYEDLAPCTHNVRFVYDWNLEFADAFPSLVNDVTLFVFDEQGLFLTSIHDEGEHLDASYRMPLGYESGKFHLVAWCGLDEAVYEVAEMVKGVSKVDDLTVSLRHAEDGSVEQSGALERLYHGEVQVELSPYDNDEVTVYLMNDTKTFNIILQNESGLPLSKDDFDFVITADNWHYDSSNNPAQTGEPVVYNSYYKEDANIATNPESDMVGVVKSENNSLRIMEDRLTRLEIYNKAEDNKKILDINLTAYLKLFKNSSYGVQGMSDQEWLDRSSEHNIVFFLNNHAVVVSINIGPWKLVFDDIDF